MESELICPMCSKPFVSPIILPCSHSVCLSCSQSSLTTSGRDLPPVIDGQTEESAYVTLYEMTHLYQSIGNLPCLKCPTCKKLFPLDSRGVNGFPRNRLLENIVNRYYAKSNGIVCCQLCEGNQPAHATVMCEQCEVAYCDRCCKTCHPSRGPLAKHSLVTPSSLKSPSKPVNVVKCSSHSEENISMYCVFCRIPVCYVCLERGQHSGHEVKALGAMFKEQKAELLANINALDRQNNELKNFIQHLHGNCSIIQENGLEFEASVVAQCDALISFIQQRKVELIDAISAEMSSKIKKVKEEIEDSEKKFDSIAGLLQYANECLQETDAASFLLVANSLNGRIINVTNQWSSDMQLQPSCGVELELTLDTSGARQALIDLHFIELKAPAAPEIVPDACTVTNNAITLSWKPRNQSCIDGFVVEVDDGTSSGKEEHFLEVYRGNSLECTISGLQFNSTYRARVKGFNKAGEGDPSDEVYLTTSDVAWFTLDPITAHPDMVLTNDNTTSTCTSFDDRVVLGNIGFSRGCHYWEVTIDRYDGNPDPAVGVALGSTIKDSILGKDDKAWCMYIDSSRSWFRHNNEHSNRRDGGVEVGSVIGVLLDIPNHRVSFYLNDQKRGVMRLPDIPEAFYAAFSLNRNVQITLHTGLEPPDEAIYSNSTSNNK